MMRAPRRPAGRSSATTGRWRARSRRSDGFDATDGILDAWPAPPTRCVDRAGRPVPALPTCSPTSPPRHPTAHSPTRPASRVRCCKSSGRTAGTRSSAGTRWRAPHTRVGRPARADCSSGLPWVISVDDHVDPDGVGQGHDLALDCGAVVVPASSDEHDAAAAAISHLPHLLAEALAVTAGEVPLAFALAAGSFRDGTRVAGTAPDLVRAMCEANSSQLVPADRVIELLSRARDSLASHDSVADLIGAGHAARTRTTASPAPTSSPSSSGAKNWREELAAAGRAGGVIRSALPSLDSRDEPVGVDAHGGVGDRRTQLDPVELSAGVAHGGRGRQ